MRGRFDSAFRGPGRNGERVASEEESSGSASDGRCAFDFAPGTNGRLHVEVDSAPDFAFTAGRSSNVLGTRDVDATAGEHALGDLVCVPRS